MSFALGRLNAAEDLVEGMLIRGREPAEGDRRLGHPADCLGPCRAPILGEYERFGSSVF
jgi:hypothetical protein